MGATLGHMFISDYNIGKKEAVGSRISIDYASCSDFASYADRNVPYSKVLEVTGWSADDKIARVVMIGAVDGSHFSEKLEGTPFPIKEPIVYYWNAKDTVACKFSLKFGMSIEDFDFEVQAIDSVDVKEFELPSSLKN